MKLFLINSYKLMFFFIPLPLFVDFSKFNFVIISIDEYNSNVIRLGIPMPIGGISFFIAIVIGYICSVVYKDRFRSVFLPTKLLLFYVFAVLPISIYSIFFAGLSVPRLIQLILPMLFISFLSFPVLRKDRLDLLKNIFVSIFLLYTLHFISILYFSNDFLNVNDTVEFSGFFGLLIYQSLVTYPAVMSLYLFLLIALVYVNRKEMLPDLKWYSFISYFLIFVLLYLLAASGRRAFLVEYFVSVLIILGFSFLHFLNSFRVKKKTLWYLLLFLMLFFSFFIFYVNTSLSSRVLSSIEGNSFDSGRVNILSKAFEFYVNNLNVFFFGGGEKDIPGFHNFLLDQIYRVGLVGMIFVYITMTLLIKKFVKLNDYGSKYPYHRGVFLFVLMSFLFLQSMINASVSQPYYFVNFLMVTVLVYFVLFSKNKTE